MSVSGLGTKRSRDERAELGAKAPYRPVLDRDQVIEEIDARERHQRVRRPHSLVGTDDPSQQRAQQCVERDVVPTFEERSARRSGLELFEGAGDLAIAQLEHDDGVKDREDPFARRR
jgi:hypothetical protein